MPAAALVTVLVLVLFAPATAFSQLSEGFEDGIPNTWTFNGPVGLDGTAQASSGITPTPAGGNSFAWISNGCSPGTPGTNCPTVATQHTPSFISLGLTPGLDLGTPSYETVLSSPIFTLTSPGGLISFDVNFITTDGTYTFADFALVQLVPSSCDPCSPIDLFVANTTNPTSPAVPPVELTYPLVASISPATAYFLGTTVTLGGITYGNVPKYGPPNSSCEPASSGPTAPCPGGPTGWMHVTYLAPAGTYTLRFTVSHLTDSSYPSALAIDNVNAPQLLSETQTLEPGVTAVYPAGNDNSKWTPSNNIGGELLTVTAVPILRSVFDANPPTAFPDESCVPYADFSAANGGHDTCVEFQAVCAQGTASSNDCETFLYKVTTNYDLPPDQSAIGGPDFLVLHRATCLQTSGLNQSIFLEYGVDRIDPHTTGGSGGISCFVATFRPGAPLITGTGTTVSSSQFVGWESPVVNTELNMVKAGSTRPLKFQWFDPPGTPDPNLTWCASPTGAGCTGQWVNLQYFLVPCSAQSGAVVNTATDISSPGNSGFQNLGGGNYQMNWQTQKSWKGSCANVEATFYNGLVVIPANPGFQFN